MEFPPEVQALANDVTHCVDKYVLVEEFRGGASGSVWKAWDRELGRWVVLKFPAAHAASEIERLHREAHLAAKLAHRNIARIYDVRLERGNTYIVMEFIDGDSLDRASLSLPEMLAAVRDAAIAIHYAHEQGVLHRDIKPANLMRDRSGHLVVLDFGIARTIQGPKEFTATGGVLGTPAFMSPEQVQGRVSPRSDIYSLGATLYTLVTGRPPFDGTDALDVLLRIARVDFPPPRAVNAKLHPDIEAVIMRAMERSPDRRYATARELADDLSRLIALEPVLAPPFTRLQRVRRVVVRHLALSVLAALVVLVALVGGIATTVITLRKNRELAAERLRSVEDEARRLRDRLRAQPVLDDARTELEQAERMLYARDLDHALFQQGLRRARDFAREALLLRPDFPEAYCILGHALNQLGQGAEADAAFARAGELAPTYLEARLARGLLHLHRYLDGRRPTVLYATGDMAVEPAPPESDAMRAERELFRREFEAVIAHSRRDEPGIFAHAALAMAAQDFETARRHFAEYVARLPGDADGFYLAGMCAIYAGDAANGAKLLEQSAAVRPWHVPTMVNLAICRMAQSRPADAIALDTRILSVMPGSTSALNNRGTAHAAIAMQEGESSPHWEQSLSDFTEALRLEPGLKEARIHRAMAFRLCNRLEESLADLNIAIATAPTVNARLQRGIVLTRLRRWTEAIADLDVVVRDQPKNDEAFALRGISRMNLELFSDAVADFDRCLQIAPGSKGRIQPLIDQCRRGMDH